MDDILVEFQSESKRLGGQLLAILESVEDDFTQKARLAEYGQIVDRIMGASQSLALIPGPLQSRFDAIGKYCEVCKIVGYKGSQITGNENLYTVVVALLLDATEMLDQMIEGLNDGRADPLSLIPKTFLDRLRWVAEQFPAGLRSSLEVSSGDISAILKSLGL